MSTRFIVLSGFLGAGKTTTMTTAAERLRADGQRVAVVTNDQGVELVDTAFAAERLDGVGEVTGGCFCCRFEDLLSVMSRLIRQEQADVIIAESVGSCTDLTATVIRPLLALHGDLFVTAPMTTVVDPIRYLRMLPDLDRGDRASDLTYLYRKQLEDAAVIAVNKVDLLEPDEVARVVTSLTQRFPQAEVVTYAAGAGEIDRLLDSWRRDHTADDIDLDVDYQRYGTAEAQLAWLDQTLDLEVVEGTFDPAGWMQSVLRMVGRGSQAGGHLVGHVKLMFQDAPTGVLTKASLIDGERPPTVDQPGVSGSAGGRAVLNARVACAPAQLERLAEAAVREADQAQGVRTVITSQRSFSPAQPEPTHRMLAGNALTSG